jgi:hypothetical protein
MRTFLIESTHSTTSLGPRSYTRISLFTNCLERCSNEAYKLHSKMVSMLIEEHLRCYKREAKTQPKVASSFDISNLLQDIRKNSSIVKTHVRCKRLVSLISILSHAIWQMSARLNAHPSNMLTNCLEIPLKYLDCVSCSGCTGTIVSRNVFCFVRGLANFCVQPFRQPRNSVLVMPFA